MFVKNRFILTGIFLICSKTRKEAMWGYVVVITQKIGFQIPEIAGHDLNINNLMDIKFEL